MKFKKLKVCGLTRPKDFYDLQELGVQYGGIIFYPPSPRYAIGKLNPQEISNFNSLKKVGVFVNPSWVEITARIDEFKLDLVQLHGDESPEFCQKLKDKVKIIKAFRIKSKEDLHTISSYEKSCTYFLFDTTGKKYGGTGKRFDWQILENYASQTPFFLSGGIGLEAVEDLKQINLSKCIGLDLNSKFEIEPGIKNINLIKNFICQLPIT